MSEEDKQAAPAAAPAAEASKAAPSTAEADLTKYKVRTATDRKKIHLKSRRRLRQRLSTVS